MEDLTTLALALLYVLIRLLLLTSHLTTPLSTGSILALLYSTTIFPEIPEGSVRHVHLIPCPSSYLFSKLDGGA